MVDIKKINEPGSARGRTRLYQTLASDEGVNQGGLSYIGPSGECDLWQDRQRILGRFNRTFHEYSGLYDHVSVMNELKRTLQQAAGNLHREEFYLFSDSLANPAVPPITGGTGNELTYRGSIF